MSLTPRGACDNPAASDTKMSQHTRLPALTAPDAPRRAFDTSHARCDFGAESPVGLWPVRWHGRVGAAPEHAPYGRAASRCDKRCTPRRLPHERLLYEPSMLKWNTVLVDLFLHCGLFRIFQIYILDIPDTAITSCKSMSGFRSLGRVF